MGLSLLGEGCPGIERGMMKGKEGGAGLGIRQEGERSK